MSACPTLAELFDLARQGRATGPVPVRRAALVLCAVAGKGVRVQR